MLILHFVSFFLNKQTRLWQKLCNRQKRGLSKVNKAFCLQPADSIWYFSLLPSPSLRATFPVTNQLLEELFRWVMTPFLVWPFSWHHWAGKLIGCGANLTVSSSDTESCLNLHRFFLSSLFGTLGTLWTAVQAWDAPISKLSATQEDLQSFYSNNSIFLRLSETSLHHTTLRQPPWRCLALIKWCSTSR